MRKLAFTLIPLLVVACDREPVAPDIPPDFSATSKWMESEYVIPVEGANWGPASCLPGSPDKIAFGSLVLREHTVVSPGGRLLDNWTISFSDDFRLEIASDTWWAIDSRLERRGVELYDGSWDRPRTLIGHHFMVFQSEATGALLYDRIQWTFMWDQDGNMTMERVALTCAVK
jgi:hypothetical protein